MKKLTFRSTLRAISNYIVFFLLVAFAVTCCMLLFVNTLADSMGLVFTSENIAAAAKLTFGNVVLITLLFATVDYIRRKILVDRPVNAIVRATQKITQGDFSVRIKPLRGVGTQGFNQIIEAVNKMAQELSGTETLRADFIANVSHELKTPLAVMGNYAAMLRQTGVSDGEKDAYAKAICDSAQKLAQLITNILKLNKLENQQIFPQAQTYDLSEQLRESLLQFESVWEQKDLQIDAAIEDGVHICSDPELLSLVWNNLFSNAVKFTPVGGRIGVQLSACTDFVTVSVSDTGCGIPAEVGQHIFEKFYQGDPSHATQGNGLGLALVKRVMDILGSEITVSSVLGEGSTFTVRIRRC